LMPLTELIGYLAAALTLSSGILVMKLRYR
jgi:hypothetical protein